MLQKVMVKCRTTEMHVLVNNLLDHYESAAIDDNDLAALFVTLATLSDEMKSVIHKAKAESNRKEMDAKRGETLAAIFHLVKGLKKYTYGTTPSIT